MSPITVFFAAGDELPQATANIAAITKMANSCPNVRFISEPPGFISFDPSISRLTASADGLALRRCACHVVVRLPMSGIRHLLFASGRTAVEAPEARVRPRETALTDTP